MSVIIAARDESAVIASTVEAVLVARPRGVSRFEVIVVDDGSGDATASVVPRHPDVVVMSQEPAGKAEALNHGIAHSTGEIIVFVDADTTIGPDSLHHLLRRFDLPNVGAVTGRVLLRDPSGLLGRSQRIEYAIGCTIERRMLDELGFMTCVSGAIGAYRRSAVIEAGGFSADTVAEDTDLALALQRAGWTVRYEGKASAVTSPPRTVRQLWRQRVRWSLGITQSMWKHRRALRESGDDGRFGRRVLPYLLFFGGLSFFGPLVDALAVWSLLTARLGQLAVLWAVLTALTISLAALALWLDDEPLKGLWIVPVQILVYRPVLYMAQLRAVQLATLGLRPRWRAERVATPPGRRLTDDEVFDLAFRKMADEMLVVGVDS